MSEWQDIATAPKDGTRILITDGLNGPEVGFFAIPTGGTEADGRWFDNTEVQLWGHIPPTHWMPIPEPPGWAEIEGKR